MAGAINERIKAVLCEIYKGNVTAMAQATNIKRTTLNSIIGSDGVSPRYEILRNIADISSPRISMEWLIRGTGPMLLSDSREVRSENSNNKNTNINDSETLGKLLSMLEEKDKQINKLLELMKTK